jgi:hypothetical protein
MVTRTKENAMKTRTRKTMKATIQVAGRRENAAAASLGWLMARGRDGRRRIEKLGWKRLAAIYYTHRPASDVRKAIQAEARRCGYTPSTILALHAE